MCSVFRKKHQQLEFGYQKVPLVAFPNISQACWHSFMYHNPDLEGLWEALTGGGEIGEATALLGEASKKVGSFQDSFH